MTVAPCYSIWRFKSSKIKIFLSFLDNFILKHEKISHCYTFMYSYYMLMSCLDLKSGHVCMYIRIYIRYTCIHTYVYMYTHTTAFASFHRYVIRFIDTIQRHLVTWSPSEPSHKSPCQPLSNIFASYF